ncbi:MAG: hypothetical protein J0L92_27095 [Deltaproteobacteria bacterium]|nr:hypothetical protein [Deltaproteobacteria bacterium]
METPALTLTLRDVLADAIALSFFEQLFGDRGLDLTHVASRRELDATRDTIWLGAETTGLRIVRERHLKRLYRRDEGAFDEVRERDVAFSAGRPGDARWFVVTVTHADAALVSVVVGAEASLLPSLRATTFRVGAQRSEAIYRAGETVWALPGLEQDSAGNRPRGLESARVTFRALEPREDASRAEILACLDAAAEEGSRRARVIAAVVRARNGAIDEGLAALEAILAATPSEPDVAALRALLLVRANRADQARTALAALPCVDEHDYLARLFVLLQLGDLHAVRAQLEGPTPRSLAMDARIGAAVVSERLGDHEGALSRARAAIAWQGQLSRDAAARVPDVDRDPLLHRLEAYQTWHALYAELLRA